MAAPYAHLGSLCSAQRAQCEEYGQLLLADASVGALGGSWLAAISSRLRLDQITALSAEAIQIIKTTRQNENHRHLWRSVIRFVPEATHPPGHARSGSTSPSVEPRPSPRRWPTRWVRALVTALPQHAIADSRVGFGPGWEWIPPGILRTKNTRLRLYFFENGSDYRPSYVIYDQEHSSVSAIAATDYD